MVHEATLITQHLCWLNILLGRSYFCDVLSSNFGLNKMNLLGSDIFTLMEQNEEKMMCIRCVINALSYHFRAATQLSEMLSVVHVFIYSLCRPTWTVRSLRTQRKSRVFSLVNTTLWWCSSLKYDQSCLGTDSIKPVYYTIETQIFQPSLWPMLKALKQTLRTFSCCINKFCI